MKTAMQEAINHLSIWLDSGLSFDKWIENYKDKYIEVEQKQINDAYSAGWSDSKSEEHPDNYYNGTYKQD